MSEDSPNKNLIVKFIIFKPHILDNSIDTTKCAYFSIFLIYPFKYTLMNRLVLFIRTKK